jgi:small-conductance mechanosensitive channel
MSTTTDLKDILAYIDRILHYKLFDLNQTPITLSSLLMFFVVVSAFYIFSKFLNRILLRRILQRFHMDPAMSYTTIRVNHYIIMTIGAIVAFQFVGINLSGLAVIFGLLSVGIGFGLQNITSNFISGLILLFERPIKVGDRVTVGETEGDVLAINMRSTTIQTLDNITIIVPNSEFISSNVTNWSYGDPKIRIQLEVGVSYESDLDTVLEALKEVAHEHPKVLNRPEPDVLLKSFGDSSWNMVLRVWIANPKNYHVVCSELNCAVVRKFREKNIEIPFPQRDLHVRSPLPLPLRTEAGKIDIP